MSWLFAAIYDPFMRKSEAACLEGWRRDLLGSLEGSVIEIGAGTGANLAQYPRALERLVLTDPDASMLKRLTARAGQLEAHDAQAKHGGSRRAPEIVRASSDALPFDSASFDVVVSTLVLCSVPDVARTLAEAKRLLRPGGSLVFLEHVAAEDPVRLRWQRRLEPLWIPISGNCHLTRATAEAIERAGFSFTAIKRESMRKALPTMRPTIRGVARRD